MSVTVLMLNWRRPENVMRIVAALGRQTLRPRLFMWDNGSGDGGSSGGFSGFDWRLTSDGRNAGCGPRWWMGAQADTEWVMTLDDDLMPGDDSLLADLVDEAESTLPDAAGILCAFGRALDTELAYEWCPLSAPGDECDVALGRLILTRADALRAMRVPHGHEDMFRADDVVVSSLASRCCCSATAYARVAELPDDRAMCREPGHFHRREVARRRWFGR